MAVKYTRSIATHFTGLIGTSINGGALTDEIHANATITIAVDHINSAGDVVDIWMKAALSTPEETALDAVCAAHTGKGTEKVSKVEVDNTLRYWDGRQIVLPSSVPSGGYMTMWTGAGDNLALAPAGIGEGQDLAISMSGAGTASVDLQFFEPIEMRAGALYTDSNWSQADKFHFYAVLGTTVTVPNVLTQGNCNIVDAGGFSILVPASGDGTADVNLSNAVPIPADNVDGYWNVDRKTGAITPAPTFGAGHYHLFAFGLAPTIKVKFIQNIALGHPQGCFTFNPEGTEFIHPNWKLRLEVVKVSGGSGSLKGYLFLFRKTAVEYI